ncbi:MAG: hypothetical protein ACRCUS_08735, partial [Anaerovoracaceae bacterium]
PEMNVGKYSREVERVLKEKEVISLPKVGGEIHSPNEILDKILEVTGMKEAKRQEEKWKKMNVWNAAEKDVEKRDIDEMKQMKNTLK